MSDAAEPWRRQVRQEMGRTPWFAAIGGEILESGGGQARAKIAWRADLVGNPDSGVIHGGVITSLLDQLCGAAVMSALPAPTPIATLDLRIDYMKPAPKGAAVFAEARCLKLTREIAFVRGSAYCDTPDEPIALCTAAFMLIGGDIAAWPRS